MKRKQIKKYPSNIFRQKLLEAIVFFSQKGNIKNPSKMMMFKLLAELDFRHFEQTGLPVTNLQYAAYPKGPVAESFQNEITKNNDLILPNDFEDSLMVEKTYFENEFGKKFEGFKYLAKRKPNLKVFTPREIKVLEDVALIYKTSTATEASKASHEPGSPWSKTITTKGEKGIIDIIETVSLKKPLTKEIAKEKIKEREAIMNNYGA